MKAILLTKTGKPTVLKFHDLPVPEPRAGEVRVKTETIGINYAEVLSRKGLYGWAPKKPYVPGMEAYGQIDKVGEGVKAREIGQKVIIGTQFGCYAEYVVVKEPKALPAISRFSPEENAAFSVNFMTAWVSLFEMARMRLTDSVLINIAAGGVGSAAVQLAKKYGCIVYGTVGSDEKIDLVNNLQIDRAINYRKEDFEEEIKKTTDGAGVDVVLEMVGGDVYKKSLRLLKPLGRLVVAGFASLDYKVWNPVSLWNTWRAIPRANILKMSERSYGVSSSHLGYLLKYPDLMGGVWRDLVYFVEKHQLKPIVGKVYDFEEIAKAHEFMESRKSVGKIVLKVKS